MQNKKLIEVALPLEAINKQAAREKSIRHGHPSTLHLWWARRPLAACRAVLFAQLVDDPSSHPDEFPTQEAQDKERQRLFGIIEELVKWKNINNEKVLNAAKQEILKSTDGNPPPILDPFCGGGSIPLEAQRLGLKAYASDLNPVAVLITKALIEIPPKFADKPPVNPQYRDEIMSGTDWKGASGLAEDVRYYGQWMRDEAEKRIGHLYPKVLITHEMAKDRPDLKHYEGQELTVIAWLWARTIKCPNPACGATMPLVRSFALSKKKGKKAFIEPLIREDSTGIDFVVRRSESEPPVATKVGRGAKFKCFVCGEVSPDEHIKSEARAERMEQQLMAVVCEGERERVYISPSSEQEDKAIIPKPSGVPTAPLAYDPRAIWCTLYGLDTFDKLFTNRQLTALTTFSDLVMEARELVLKDAVEAGLPDDSIPLRDGGKGAEGYADSISVYLGFGVDRSTNTLCTLSRWTSSRDQTVTAFARQALPMTWDFPEVNPLAGAAGDIRVSINSISEVIKNTNGYTTGMCIQQDARHPSTFAEYSVLATDPPYYDNIGYADLSDYFYVWLRRSLNSVFPSLFSTLLTPKSDELVATPYRFDGNKQKAEEFFEGGLRLFFKEARENQISAYPMTVMYAFKQAELDNDGLASTGWETMLNGMLEEGYEITGTWPIRSELSNRPVASGTNALASSIVIAARTRQSSAGRTTRREFIAELKRELPSAIRTLQKGNIAPVDLAQSSIGPGMAVFSKYSEVLEADGSKMSVRTALALINEVLHEVLTEQEGDFDTDTRWALAWFEQFGFKAAPYGEAETLSKAKNTSVDGMVQAGILEASRGKVRLLRKEEYPLDWDPSSDRRLTVWEIAHYLILYIQKIGEKKAAELRAKVVSKAESARELAYRLYQICDEKGWAKEAFDYNTLVSSWGDVTHLASAVEESVQGDLFEQGD